MFASNALGRRNPRDARPLPDTFFALAPQAPGGMMARATYTIKSSFIDDDKEAHLSWEWHLKIAKDW